MIISWLLITFPLDCVLTLSGEYWCWSLKELKGLKPGFPWWWSWSRRWSLKSANDLVKIKNWSHKGSHKHNWIGVRTIRTFLFSSDSTFDLHHLRSAYDQVKTRLLESEAEAEGVTQSQCTFQRFVTLCRPFLVLPIRLCLWLRRPSFHLIVNDGVISRTRRMRMLFSPDHKFYSSDYNSNPKFVSSDNQP